MAHKSFLYIYFGSFHIKSALTFSATLFAIHFPAFTNEGTQFDQEAGGSFCSRLVTKTIN